MEGEGEFKLVILMRSDLKMSKGKTAAQAAHAAVTCALASKKNDTRTFDRWMSEGQKKVVLKVTSLKELYEFKAIADAQRITNSLITDQGRTEIPAGSVTCMGLGPAPNAVLDKINGGLSML